MNLIMNGIRLKYFGIYVLIIYLVYLIANLIAYFTGIGFIILGFAFFIFFVIYFIRFSYKLTLFKNLNKAIRFFLLLTLAIFPIYIVFLGFRINDDNCKNRLNELGNRVEKYHQKNRKYPESLNDVSTLLSRVIKSPFLLLPLPTYKYETNLDRDEYSIQVFEDSYGVYVISSTHKEARWFD